MARNTPVGGVAKPAPKTPPAGFVAQPEPAVDIDDDLAIPVDDSSLPSVRPAAVPSGLAIGASPAVAAASAASDAPGMSLAPSPALPFAQPRAEGKFDDVSTAPARPIPRASTDTTPLPPPPMGVVGSATDGQVEHPRAPAEWIADRGDSRPARSPSAGSRGKDPSAEEAALLGASARGGAIAPKKVLMIGGGVAVLALVLIIALTRGGSSTKKHASGATPAHGSAVAMTETGGSAAQVDESGEATATQPAHDRHGSPHGTVVASAGSAALATGPDETLGSAAAGSAEAGSDAGSAAVAPVPKHHPTLGGKQVVLEYDNAAHAPPTPAPAPREDTAAVEKARVAYATGNQKLFAGDAAGAVRAYQQALDAYPGYVAGYRGLGLAYTQQGDKAKALQAFHTYLNNAPGAHDAALIRKRVTALAH